jgi:hypothetical protein
MGAALFVIDHEQLRLRALPVPGQDLPDEPLVDGSTPGRGSLCTVGAHRRSNREGAATDRG